MNWIAAHWQEVLTFVVLALAAGYQILRLYRTARGRHTDTGCASCPAHRLRPRPDSLSRIRLPPATARQRRAPPAR